MNGFVNFMKYVLSAAGYLFLNKCVLDTGVFLFPLLHEQFLWLCQARPWRATICMKLVVKGYGEGWENLSRATMNSQPVAEHWHHFLFVPLDWLIVNYVGFDIKHTFNLNRSCRCPENKTYPLNQCIVLVVIDPGFFLRHWEGCSSCNPCLLIESLQPGAWLDGWNMTSHHCINFFKILVWLKMFTNINSLVLVICHGWSKLTESYPDPARSSGKKLLLGSVLWADPRSIRGKRCLPWFIS